MLKLPVRRSSLTWCAVSSTYHIMLIAISTFRSTGGSEEVISMVE
jgi:hypothetical protein